MPFWGRIEAILASNGAKKRDDSPFQFKRVIGKTKELDKKVI